MDAFLLICNMKINSTISQFILVILLTTFSFQISTAATIKTSYTSKYVRRAPGGGPNLISFSLLKNNYGVGYTNIDGIVAVFDSSFTKNLGPEDSQKLFNGGENITFYDASAFLSIDGLPNPVGGDTINLYMYNLQNDSSYKLSIDATMFYYNTPGAQGYVLDRFLSTTTKLNVDSNVIAFKPKTANIATFRNRFAVFFKQKIIITNTTNLSGCNTLTYKGNTYTSSIILRDTVKSFEGMDSIYNITNIDIDNIVSTINNISLSGCNSILYNGKTYTTTTILKDTLKSIQGCDSIYNVINISVNPISATTNNINLSGCNKITYKGVTYFSSIILKDTLKSFQGCDSIYNIANIVITPIVTSIHNIQLSGCSIVLYNGNTYSNSTTISDTIKSVQGCDSIYKVATIVITPIVASTHNIPLSGCNSVLYNGNTYTNSTIVRDTVKSYQGCDSIYNIANIVITPIVASTHNIPLSGCNSVLYNGNTYTNSTTIRDTIKSYQGCDSIYNVANIVITPIVASTHNIPLSGCSSVLYNGNTYTNSTTVRDTIKSIQGCDSIYNVANIVITPIIASTHNIPLSGCSSILFNGITYTNSATVRDTIKSVQGCDSIYNVVNIVITNPVTPTVTLGSNAIIANGSTVTFTANAVNGGLGTIYTFMVNSAIVQTGASNTYSTSVLHVGDTVSCAIISHATCVTDSNAVSNKIIMITNVPLTLLGFQASLNEYITNCSWQTTAEINTAFFNLQRSINGTEFSTINVTKAAGTSTTESTYSYKDAIEKELQSVNAIYYRLQIVDKDGKYTYSKVVKVSLSNKNEFIVYPNPAKHFINVSGLYIRTIQISDISGKILLIKENVNSDASKIDISSFSKGLYFITILSNNGDRQIKKLVIE